MCSIQWVNSKSRQRPWCSLFFVFLFFLFDHSLRFSHGNYACLYWCQWRLLLWLSYVTDRSNVSQFNWRIYASANQPPLVQIMACRLAGAKAIIWTNAGILLIGPLGTNLSEILRKIHTFSRKKMHLKMSCGKWRPFFLGLNVLIDSDQNTSMHHVSE